MDDIVWFNGDWFWTDTIDGRPLSPKKEKTMTQPKVMNLCKYCKWCSWDGVLMSAWRVCEHPGNVDPVDGKRTITCNRNRSETGRCGPDGKLWEALSAEKAWREYRKSGEAVESFEEFKQRWERINVRQTAVGTVEPRPR